MHTPKALLLAVPLVALALTNARDASACGGCFTQQTEDSQVTGHKMILSVSKTQSTLWDQISYSGNPASFAWILPTKGIVEVGLSSDALFQNLDQDTKVTVASPVIQCSPPPDCGGFGGPPNAGGGDNSADAGGVSVLAQDVVGPYETVQLNAADPLALKNWLLGHNYNIPADVSPIIDAYVNDGFNFLALKLVPGQGVSAMRPVRVTTPGASPVLPLRMVAAGTGAVTSITLWVMAEGRYEPANLPSFIIDQAQLVWNWDTKSSNYSKLKQTGFDSSSGKAWLIEAGEPFSRYVLSNQITFLAQSDPKGSGYADDMGQGAPQAAAADLDAIFSDIPDASLWITRLHGELSRAVLADDLEVGASADQTSLNRYLQATKAIGAAPPCPTFPPCSNGSGEGSNGGWDFWSNPASGDKIAGGGGCAMTAGEGASAAMSVLVLAAALALSRRRRRPCP